MSDRCQLIEQALVSAYNPENIKIIDDSHLHAGHASAGSKGHFTVEIIAEAFRNKPLLERHRMIYATLAELLESDIHALSIKANAPNT
mgnify:CR=1 FL=1